MIYVPEPLSLATSLLMYAADDDRLLSFPRNVKAKIFSKEAGDNPTLWEAEVTLYVGLKLLRLTTIALRPTWDEEDVIHSTIQTV